MFLDLDEVGFSEDDNLDRLNRLTRRILEFLDFRNDPKSAIDLPIKLDMTP